MTTGVPQYTDDGLGFDLRQQDAFTRAGKVRVFLVEELGTP
jgi:hypothetical protein